jgi:hypothetical protein
MLVDQNAGIKLIEEIEDVSDHSGDIDECALVLSEMRV